MVRGSTSKGINNDKCARNTDEVKQTSVWISIGGCSPFTAAGNCVWRVDIIIIIIIDIHTRQGAIYEKEEREKEDSREAGSVDQWPAGLCPVANRGLKGSWTDHWPTHVQHRNRKCDIYN